MITAALRLGLLLEDQLKMLMVFRTVCRLFSVDCKRRVHASLTNHLAVSIGMQRVTAERMLFPKFAVAFQLDISF
jgi:hypothetical protein